MENEKLFSNRHIITSTLIGGPITATLLFYLNYEKLNKKKSVILTKSLGFIATVIMYAIISIALLNYFNDLQEITNNLSTALIISFSILFCIHTLYTGILNLFFKEKLFRKSNSKLINKEVLPYILIGFITSILYVMIPPIIIILLILFFPCLYIHKNIKQQIGSKLTSTVFSIVFFLGLAFVPIAESLNHAFYSSAIKIPLYIAYFFLPTILYLLLFILLKDIILNISRVFKKQEPNTILVKSYIVLTIIFTAFIIIWGNHNFNNLKLNTYNVDIHKKQSNIDTLKVLMTADIHLNEVTTDSFMDELIETINNRNADLVLFPGDIVEAYRKTKKTEYFTEKLKEIKSTYGVYASTGNHEYINHLNFKLNFFNESNIHMLNDTAITINNINLIGRNDLSNKKRKPLENIINNLDTNLLSILLDHQPTGLDEAYNNNIDIQVSGHTHHGQLFPFNYLTEAIFELSWGYKQIKNTHFFVTSGAQAWGPRVKTVGDAEIMEINITFKNEDDLSMAE